MNDEELKKQIGKNIVLCRKRMLLTQAGLAEKLNYSDKAVSKWERGESIPDVLTLMQLADVLGVTVDYLLTGNDNSVIAVIDGEKPKANKNVIAMLASVLVWFVALLTFVALSYVLIPKSWIVFIYAVPVNAIVLLSLFSAWKMFRLNPLFISLIVWGGLLSLYISALLFMDFNMWMVFLLGIPGQIAILLWFRIYKSNKKDSTDGQERTA